MSKGGGLLTAILLAVVAVLLFDRFKPDPRPVQDADGRVISQVIGAKLDGMNDLRVGRLTGRVQSVASVTRLGGLLQPRRVTQAPFQVDYFVDLSRLDRSDFRWNERDRTVIVSLPDVRVGLANVDESRTILDETSGLFVSRGTMAELRKIGAGRAQVLAGEAASRPAHIEAARRHGRIAVSSLFERPLRVAGIDASVRVRYPGEATQNSDQWDLTRSLEEISAEGCE